MIRYKRSQHYDSDIIPHLYYQFKSSEEYLYSEPQRSSWYTLPFFHTEEIGSEYSFWYAQKQKQHLSTIPTTTKGKIKK